MLLTALTLVLLSLAGCLGADPVGQTGDGDGNVPGQLLDLAEG